jgi:hypothetical protein
MRREAGFEDGLQLVVHFWISIKPSVRKASQNAISNRFDSNKLPMKLDEMIELLSGYGDDTPSAASIGARNSNNSGHRYSHKRQRNNGDNNNKNNHAVNMDASTSKKLYKFNCGEIWFSGHKCEEFFKAKQDTFKHSSECVKRSSGESACDSYAVSEEQKAK